jgi:hypothetical protein
MAPEIIYEDDILLVCNKPAGLMVEPDRNNYPNLLQQVKKRLEKLEINVLTHSILPTNDGSLSLGQSVITAAKYLKEIT